MQQVAQNYRSGELTVLDTPPPACRPGGVLVETRYSLISSGTELMKVNESRMSLAAKARARPDQVAKVIEAASRQGPVAAYRKAMARLDAYSALGYSLAGVVSEVGPDTPGFTVGQLVACAGNEFALHAEVNWIPRNLCVPVPAGVTPAGAAFSTVGAIALQGVRQARPALGETACVIGLGLVGQLVVRLLVAAGVRVWGFDVIPERCGMAELAGAVCCAPPDSCGIGRIEQSLADGSGGLGADHVFLVAGGDSTGPVRIAARLARDRATVVDIGKCKLDLPWNAYYEKELQVRFSRSYGPGRYDPSYELDGADYPPGYVRWTERRNVECFLDLVASGAIDPAPLVSGVFPLSEAPSVYERLQARTLTGVGYLLECPARSPGATSTLSRVVVRPTVESRHLRPRARPRPRAGSMGIGFIGAGAYASTMLLPHLAGRDGVDLVHVATTRSLSALNAQRKFGFQRAGTDVDELLADDRTEAVFVVTRHSSHCDLTCRALEAGKQVFVEKPLALSLNELERIRATVETTGNDRLMVGFNRRFSPLFAQMRSAFGDPDGPIVMRYLVNAGSLPADSWYRDEQAEGSRFTGEGGHFVDTLSWWVGDEVVEVAARPLAGRGSIHAELRFAGGSLGLLTYITDGNDRFPKETFDAAGGAKSARLDNFTRAVVWSGRRRRVGRALITADKGQQAEIDAFLGAARSGAPLPIPLTSLFATTRASLAVSASLVSGHAERL